MSVRYGIKNTIDKLHYSIIIFDQQDVESSGFYALMYGRKDFNYSGGFIPIPIEFADSFVLGFTNFSSPRTNNIIYFTWNTSTVSGSFGLFMEAAPYPVQGAINPVVYYGFTYLYIKTWDCGLGNFFLDETDEMCTACPIENCSLCQNLTSCKICVDGFYADPTTLLCNPCPQQGCLQC